MVLSALSFNGYRADLFATAVGFAVAALMSGLSVRLQPRAGRASGGLTLAMLPFTLLVPDRDSSKLARLAFVGGLTVLACAVPATVATQDWDFLFQKLSAVAIWTGAFAFFFATQARMVKKTYSLAALVLILSVSVGWYRILESSKSLRPDLLNDETLDVSTTLDRYANYDVSFKVVRELLRRRFVTTAATGRDDQGSDEPSDSFYAFLQRNTNLLPNIKVEPVEINLVDNLQRTDGVKLNIFIFVIDSLRQDYLSPYNKAVRFTPNIEKFAQESVVLRNAFTNTAVRCLPNPQSGPDRFNCTSSTSNLTIR